MSQVIECLHQIECLQQIDNKKDYYIQNKCIYYKIFELKYGNTKPLGNTKHNQVNLVLAVFLLLICTNRALNTINKPDAISQ